MLISCPFDYCSANVSTIREQAAPAPADGLHVERIPVHEIVGTYSWWGPCPASLMTAPPAAASRGVLSEVADAIKRAERRRGDVPESGGGTETPRHSRSPRPVPDAKWFRSRTGDNPRGEAAPPPPVPLSPSPTKPVPTEPTRGGAVATAGEIRARLAEISERIAEAQAAVNQQVGGPLAEAVVSLQDLAEQSVDPMGIPQLAQAVELTMQVSELCRLAIEAAQTYGGTL